MKNKKQIKCFNIKYSVEDKNQELINPILLESDLEKELIINEDTQSDIEEMIVNAISDQTGWLVDSFDLTVEEVKQTPTESDNTLDQFMKNDKLPFSSNLKVSSSITQQVAKNFLLMKNKKQINQEEFKLTNRDFEVCKTFLIYAERQIDFVKEEIEKAYNSKDWNYLGVMAWDMDCLTNMKSLIGEYVNSTTNNENLTRSEISEKMKRKLN
mgnify:CR=1 FL=1|jgi:hypothetical protein